MRISDWSSDVCSSDLLLLAIARVHLPDLDDLAHSLHVEAVALGFGKHVLNVFAQPLLLFLQSLDPLDIRAKLLARLAADRRGRSEEHTSELQSLMRISYAVFCLKKKTQSHKSTIH